MKERINEKYNAETAEYINEYLKINKELFGNFLPIDQLSERLTNNLKGNIDYPFGMVKERKTAIYDKNREKVLINPIKKIASIFSKNAKSELKTIMMHELDHAALAGKDNEGKFVSGIEDKLEHKSLNEGITAYKERLYAEKLGTKFSTGYKNPLKVVEFIEAQIGREELIKNHYNNNYEGIAQAFREKTGTELDDLVNLLNDVEEKSQKKNFFSRFNFLKKDKESQRIDEAIQKIKENAMQKNKGKAGQDNEESFRDQMTIGAPTLEEQAKNSQKFQEILGNNSGIDIELDEHD